MQAELTKLRLELSKRIDGAKLSVSTLPDCPDISLYLLDKEYPQWQLSADQASQLMDAPPFWSFCWASGQVLAKFIKMQPTLVEKKQVADFGAGSGVVAIAAMQAGASKAIACDSDSDARTACICNAALNQTTIETLDSLYSLPKVDVITVADVFYDRDNLPLLKELQKRCKKLLVADSRLRGSPLPGMHIIDSFHSHTVPDLDESNEFRHVFIYSNEN